MSRFIVGAALLAATGLLAAEPAAKTAAVQTLAAEGAYHVGRLKFETPGKQSLELVVNFRGGKGVSNMLFVGGPKLPAAAAAIVYPQGTLLYRLWLGMLERYGVDSDLIEGTDGQTPLTEVFA